MSASSLPTDRARVVRWPSIALLAAAILVMVIVGDDRGQGAGTEDTLERPIVPTAGRAEALSSAWYCAAGTIVADGIADHTVVVANPATRPAQVELTVFPVLAPQPLTIDLDADDVVSDLTLTPPQAVDLGAVAASVTVPAQSLQRLRLAELEGVGGEHAAVLVESDVGQMVVEHIGEGPAGVSLAPCASTAADAWYFAAGTTRKGAREIISIFNPFPGDAVVDLTFTADGSVRAPRIYEGLVVPSGSVLPVEITDVVTLFDLVSARLEVRTGRVIADRLLALDGSEGAGGLSMTLGSPATSDVWVFASSGGAGAVDAIAITNPNQDEATVDVEVRLDVAEFNGTVEPIGITIRPGRTEVVVLTEGAELVSTGRVVDSSGRILDDVGFWVAVRSTNGVAVVADRVTGAGSPTPIAFSASPGAPVAATSHIMTSGDGGGEVAIVNPASDRIAQIDVRLMVDGQEFQVTAAEVGQQSRLVLDMATLGIPADAIVLIDSSDPVLLERRLALSGAGQFSAQAVPVAGTTSAPVLPLG